MPLYSWYPFKGSITSVKKQSHLNKVQQINSNNMWPKAKVKLYLGDEQKADNNAVQLKGQTKALDTSNSIIGLRN